MRADPDYTAYVVARWSPAVRVLAVLGVPPERTADLAVGAFARMLPDWGRLRREGDPDVELARLVLDAWVREGGRDLAGGRRPAPVVAARVVTRELEEQLALLDRLADGLARVDETTRLTVALRHLGELEVEQVAEVLGEPPTEVRRRLADAAQTLHLVPLDPACHEAAGAIDVPPPDVDLVVARAGATRRRRWLVAGATVAALALVASGSYVLTRPDPAAGGAMEALDVTPVENRVGVVWWLDGTLHLDHGTARVPDVAQLADAGFGVAYADTDGAVVWLTEDGARRRIGTMDPRTSLLGQPQVGKVAWIEPDGDDGGGGDLVVWSVVTMEVVAREPVAGDAQLLGWDRDRLYLRERDRDRVLTVTSTAPPAIAPVTAPEGLERSQVVDVAAGVELRRQDGRLSLTLPFFNVTPEVPGVGGALSLDGSWVLTVDEAGVPSAHDVRDGSQQGPWFDPAWSPVAATFTRDGRIVWVVDQHNGSYGLVDCQVREQLNLAFDPNSRHCKPQLDLGAVPLLADTAGLVAPAG